MIHKYRICIVAFLFSCNNTSSIISIIDDGQVIETYEINSDSLKHGLTKKYYPSGAILEKSIYHNGELDGIRTLYFENGNPEIIENYCHGVICDTLLTFYENGIKSLEGFYVNGEMTGMVKGFYDTGELKEEVTFVANEEHGSFVEYHKNGRKKWQGFYMKGPNEFGELTEYDSKGKIIKKMLCDSMSVCRTIWKPELGNIQAKRIFQ